MVILLNSRRLTFINGLRLLWLLVVLWCEVGVFRWSLVGCHWPDMSLNLHAPTTVTRILLVADPQILDSRSYPERPWWLVSLTQYVVDFNLRKNWDAVVGMVTPDIVVFLGDMIDNGRATVDELEYKLSYDRFKSIFQLDASIPVYHLPGNHDVDLGYSTGSSRARDHYHDYFGPTNQRISIGNHTELVLFDAPGLVDEEYHRYAAGMDLLGWQGRQEGALRFLKDFIKLKPKGLIVLFSHIPFHRSDQSSCGPLREKGTIRSGAGQGYQNLLLQETSSFILENIRPSVVFSGDDHDYCEHHHYLQDGSTVREVSVKSFSMAMGIRRPGIQLLSVTSPSNNSSVPASTLADVPCFLPDQVKIYTHYYAPLAFLTVTLLFFANYQRRHWRRRRTWSKPPQPQMYPPSGLSEPSTPFTQRYSPVRGSPAINADDPNDDEESEELTDLPSVPSASIEDPHLGPDGLYTLPLHAPGSHQRSGKRLSPEPPREPVPLTPIKTSRQTGIVERRAWYARAMTDLCQVGWPPLVLYTIISLWMFR